MTEQQPSQRFPDPLIDEVRAVRKALSDEYDNDVVRLCEHLRDIQRQHPDRIRKAPKRDRGKQHR